MKRLSTHKIWIVLLLNALFPLEILYAADNIAIEPVVMYLLGRNKPSILGGDTSISENQTFIVPSDAPNGEYVGKIRLFPEFEVIGDGPSFTLTQNSDSIFVVNSSGLITIADNRNLIADNTYFLSVKISKNGSSEQSVSISIKVVDATKAIFIDGDAATNGSGTRISPFNTVPPITQDNTILLFKRDSTITSGTNYINGVNQFMAASYGSGDKPLLQTSGIFFRIYNHSNNPTIRDLKFTTPEPSRSNPSALFANWGTAIYTSGHTGTLQVLHCEMHHLTSGISDVSADFNDAENSTHKWNYIHDISQEGVFCKLISGTTTISNNQIERINLLWFEDQREVVSSGDGIQTYQTHRTIVENNYIDRSYTGNKFCIIVDTYSTGSSGEGHATEDVTISNNYLIGTLNGNTSILIYGYFLNGTIAYNYGSRSEYFVMTGTSNNIIYKYNVVIRGQIRDSHAHVYNNVFYGPITCLTSGHGADEFYNNIVFMTADNQQVYQQGSVTEADYNLYNLEQSNMFGSGFHTLVSTGQETNSLVVDPLFTDVTNYDFTLMTSSPAIDKGKNLHLKVDYFLNPIGNQPDIGVHEVQ
jgi:hypothetical protein